MRGFFANAFLFAAICAAMPSAAGPAQASLAEDYASSGDHAAAAREFRRLEAAAAPGDAGLRGALLLSAAESYRQIGDWSRMGRMLDKLEEESDLRRPIEGEIAFLRMKRAEGLGEWASAAEWGETLADSLDGDHALAARRLAAADWLMAGDADSARAAAAGQNGCRDAIDRYDRGCRKSPKVGGWLGVVPGLGYAYSGEWGNAMRSLFLNGIFGWAMYETADHDQWGLFAVTTFFELTWFTGSIYGGIDAAHRYNRDRLGAAADEIRGGAAPALVPDHRLDILSLRLEF